MAAMVRRSSFGGWLSAATAVFAFVVMAAPAQAAITYQYVAGQTVYTGSPGQALSVPIFLRETVTSPSSSLIVSETGIFGAGFSAVQSGTPVSFSLAANTAQFGGPSTINATSLSESIAPSAAGVQGSAVGSVRDV